MDLDLFDGRVVCVHVSLIIVVRVTHVGGWSCEVGVNGNLLRHY